MSRSDLKRWAEEDLAAMESGERRVWVKIRCWHRMTMEQAAFLRELDAVRGYVLVPEMIRLSAQPETAGSWDWDGEDD